MRIGVLPGGASRGAFQVGMLKAAKESGHPGYDGYTCISVGSINGSELCMHTHFDEAVDALVEKWLNLDTVDIYKHHLPFSYLHSFWTPSLYDTSPLVKKMRAELHQERLLSSGKHLRVGAWSTKTRKLSWFDETHPKLVEAVLASSAMPIMFAPQFIDKEQFVDGGVDTVTPLKKAIEMGATEIDVFLTESKGGEYDDLPWKDVIDAGKVTIETLIGNVQRKDLKIAELYNRLVTAGLEKDKREIKIRCIEPIVSAPGSPLDFSNYPIREMIEVGYASWKAVEG